LKTVVKEARVEYFARRLRVPLVLSAGLITEVSEARVMVVVEAGGVAAAGHGSIYLSDLWAWPDAGLSHDEKDAALRALCDRIAASLPGWCASPDHPLEQGLELHDRVCADEDSGVPSILARSMCASPFDAAIHDAAGQALKRSAFAFYETERPSRCDSLFKNGSATRAIRGVIREPVSRLPAWLVVGKNDSFDEDVAPWIRDKEYSCFKLKIMGSDNAVDAQRTRDVFRAVKAMGVARPRLTIDSNEANPDADSVLDYLHQLKAADADAFEALEYIEQPTGRDIEEHAFDWRAVAAWKPVLLDEGLTSLELLPLAKEQGWNGLALKTCKGHSFALVAAAWAHENGMLVSLQDLTNPGYSMIHAALFSAYIPMINGVELNSPQFTPDANSEWLPRLAALMDPSDGHHELPDVFSAGLGGQM
jgi:L-alanine-DL-glutamate epimerase-like enolase superfamily enzyme